MPCPGKGLMNGVIIPPCTSAYVHGGMPCPGKGLMNGEIISCVHQYTYMVACRVLVKDL